MITVSKTPEQGSEKKLIAHTSCDEYAYYSPSYDGEEDPPGSDGFPVRSFSGQNWIPQFEGVDRMTMFIAGNPGAGKSYFAKDMINLFPKTFKILLFTSLEESDGNFAEFEEDKDRFFKINMDPDNLSTFSLEEIRNRTYATYISELKEKLKKTHRRKGECQDVVKIAEEKPPGIILLFDDVDKIKDKKVADLTFGIMEDALANGRGHRTHDGKGDIHVLCTSHALNDYRKTKYTLENSNYVVLFPASTTNRQMHTMFEKIGLDRELCEELIKMGKKGEFRSIIIHKIAPMYIIFGSYIMLI